MTIVDREGQIFIPHPNTNNGFIFVAHQLIPYLYLKKKLEKRLPENPDDILTSF